MKTVDVQPHPSADDRIDATVTTPDGEHCDLYIQANTSLVRDATPWLPAELPIAMTYGVPLELDGSVDVEALNNSEQAQRVLAGWYPALQHVEVSSTEKISDSHRTDGVGCFFSGGVDSWFSVLRNRDRITHLIFAHGFDIPIDDERLAGLALDGARASAAALDLPLIEVSTNLRKLSNGLTDWQWQYHGAAMAAVAIALSDHIGEAIVPGSYAEDDLHPWGTHPALDPHWSSSRVTFTHDAIDVTRPQKVRELANHQVALDHLRVCFRNRDGAYNCGQCEKCLRTMINLRTAGALGRCKTLPTEFDLGRVRRMQVDHGADLFLAENLEALAQLPERDVPLERALRQARALGKARRPAREAAKRGRDLVYRAMGRRTRTIQTSAK